MMGRSIREVKSDRITDYAPQVEAVMSIGQQCE